MQLRLSSARLNSFVSCYASAGSSASSRARTLSSLASTSASARTALRTSRRRSACTHASVVKRLFHATARSSAPAKDPYQTLGLGKDTTAAEIKKKYFSLARKYHPDTNPDKDAREKFQDIQDAYDTLKDDKKRAAYDKYGSASQQAGFDADAFEQMRSNPFAGGGFGGFGGMGGGRSGGAEDLFSSLFGSAFEGGGFGGRPTNTRGDDLESSINISFSDACKGTTRTVNTTPVKDCHTCTGTGLKAGAKRTTCGTCKGSGTQRFVLQGGFQVQSACGTCGGSGSTTPRGSSCGTCDGVGKLRQRQAVSVEVPPGAEDGMVFRMPGKGDAPISGKGKTGDLLVRVNVASSKVFRRQGPNLYHEARIPFHTALLGGRVRIPTLDGDVEVRVPSGTQQGEEMVLKKRGVASRVSGYVDQGDLFVSFRLKIPRSLTDRQRALLQQYADDVEGRSTSNSDAPPPSSSKDTSEKSTTSKVATDDNGTGSFTPPPSPTEGGWASRIRDGATTTANREEKDTLDQAADHEDADEEKARATA